MTLFSTVVSFLLLVTVAAPAAKRTITHDDRPEGI